MFDVSRSFGRSKVKRCSETFYRPTKDIETLKYRIEALILCVQHFVHTHIHVGAHSSFYDGDNGSGGQRPKQGFSPAYT